MTTLTLNTSLLSSRRILAAFSGGLDSTVLLHQLVLWRERHPDVTLRAIHIHHGLSPHADSWVRHCETVCERWQVPLVVERVTLADNGLGIEAHAREARYRAFAQTLLHGEVLATAQHLDDQCETFLLALKRGSGPAGLSAMGECSPFAGTLLLRPLLRETRKTLEQWAVRHGLCWIEDESNQDDAYDRNFLRLRALPLLQQRWPHFPAAVARSATLCAEQERLLDELLASDLTDCITAEGTLRLSPLMSMSDVRRAAILRRWLAMRNAPMPSRDALERIWQEVALARDDASPCLRFGDHEIRRYQSQLWWIKSVAGQHETTVARPAANTAGAACRLRDGTARSPGELRRPREEESVSIRFKAPWLLHIVGRHGGRKLKKIWQEQDPPRRRDTTPLLFYGETLIAAAGVFVTREGAAEDKEGVSLVWHA